MFGRKRKYKVADVEITLRTEKEEVDFEIEKSRSREKAKLELGRMLHERARARRELPEWAPEVHVKDYAAGKFLCVAGHEIPIAHISDVEVLDIGGEPYIRGPFFFDSDEGAYKATDNKSWILINMASGVHHSVRCWDFQVDVMKGRIEQAWKEGK